MDEKRAAVRELLRCAMRAEFADITAEASADVSFSPAFEARMSALLAKEKRAALHSRAWRTVVVAAILAASLLLVGWTPAREFIVELWMTVREGIVDYGPGPGLRTEIETVYGPAWLPEGFEEVSREMLEDWNLEVIYQCANGDKIQFEQSAPWSYSGGVDNENAEILAKQVGEVEVLLSLPDGLSTATWVQDRYLMEIIYWGKIELEDLERIILSVSPAN